MDHTWNALQLHSNLQWKSTDTIFGNDLTRGLTGPDVSGEIEDSSISNSIIGMAPIIANSSPQGCVGSLQCCFLNFCSGPKAQKRHWRIYCLIDISFWWIACSMLCTWVLQIRFFLRIPNAYACTSPGLLEVVSSARTNSTILQRCLLSLVNIQKCIFTTSFIHFSLKMTLASWRLRWMHFLRDGQSLSFALLGAVHHQIYF